MTMMTIAICDDMQADARMREDFTNSLSGSFQGQKFGYLKAVSFYWKNWKRKGNLMMQSL